MDRRRSFAGGAEDRLCQLGDRVLGHILSFLPAKEAARAASLSSRWRDVFAGVHTVVLEQPESPIREPRDAYSPGWCSPPDPNQPPPFFSTVSAALLAHNRRGAVPLRALRIATAAYDRSDSSTMDQWVSFAVKQAAPEGLDLDLRLQCHRKLCRRRRAYSLRRRDCDSDSGEEGNPDGWTPSPASRDIYVSPGVPNEAGDPPRTASADVGSDDDDSSVVSTKPDDDDDRRFTWSDFHNYIWSITRGIYSCAQLRSLSLGSCRLDPPANVSMPSLETLLLSHVPDTGTDVERLVSGLPRLVDLTLEACHEVTALSVPTRLRRLALRCCHSLATVTVDHSSELRVFEYRGAVPDKNFLSFAGGVAGRVAYCKVDICGEEVCAREDVVKLAEFLQLFGESVRYLHLESARLGSGLDNDDALLMTTFPSFPCLRRLELRGQLPDDETSPVAAVSRILEHALNLEAISLAFHPEEHDQWSDCRGYYIIKERDLLDAHHLSFNPHSTIDDVLPVNHISSCLRNKVKEIDLIHYQGGNAQRTLAKFLLSNALVMDELQCQLAEGPLWTQTQLMREIKGWVKNKSAAIHIS